MRYLLLVPLLILLSCSSFHKLKREVQNLDDAMVEQVVAEVEELLKAQAARIEADAIKEARANKEMVSEVDNKILKKSYDRLEPIVSKALEDIKPIVKKAANEIQAQVREEILEELTGEEINEACPDCDKKPAEPETTPDKTVSDDTAKAEVKPAPEPAKTDTAKTEAKPATTKAEPATTKAEPAAPAKAPKPEPVKAEAKPATTKAE